MPATGFAWLVSQIPDSWFHCNSICLHVLLKFRGIVAAKSCVCFWEFVQILRHTCRIFHLPPCAPEILWHRCRKIICLFVGVCSNSVARMPHIFVSHILIFIVSQKVLIHFWLLSYSSICFSSCKTLHDRCWRLIVFHDTNLFIRFLFFHLSTSSNYLFL